MMLTQGDGRRGVAEQKVGNVEGMMTMRQECWGQNKKSGEQKDGKAEGMQGLPDRALISTDQNIRLLNIYGGPLIGGDLKKHAHQLVALKPTFLDSIAMFIFSSSASASLRLFWMLQGTFRGQSQVWRSWLKKITML